MMSDTTVEERLARIEAKLDNALGWLSKRDQECEILAKAITDLRVEQGRQGVIVYLFTGVIASVLSVITSVVFAIMAKK